MPSVGLFCAANELGVDSDRVTLSGGFVMLGRADHDSSCSGFALEAKSKNTTRFPLPMAKAAYRLTKDGGRSETWAYLTGGLGGTTWAVTRLSNATSGQGSPSPLEQTDEFSLRDYRLLLGWERQISGGGALSRVDLLLLAVCSGKLHEWR